MAEPNEPSETLKQLLKMIKEPLKTSAGFSASHQQAPSRPLLQFRPIAAAPPTGHPNPPTPSLPTKTPRSRKRKAGAAAGEGAPAKKKRILKPKEGDSTKVAKAKTFPQLPSHLWVNIAERCSPKDVKKLMVLNKGINGALQAWKIQMSVAQIIETFGSEMPTTFAGLPAARYNDLFGGNGCVADGCNDKKAKKAYWPFARRWCKECWEEKTIKESDFVHMMTERIVSNDRASAMLLVLCIPHGVCDSYNKARDTIIGPLPQNAVPKLYKIYEKAAVEDVIKTYIDFVPPVYVPDPKLSDAQNATAATARAQLRMQKRNERVDHFKAMREQNDLHMAKVMTIEKSILRAGQGSKDARASLRAKKKETYEAKAIAELPDIPLASMIKLQCWKDAVRHSVPPRRDVNWDQSWGKLKKKIQIEMCKLEPDRATEISSAFTSRNSTPSASSPTPSQPSIVQAVAQEADPVAQAGPAPLAPPAAQAGPAAGATPATLTSPAAQAGPAAEESPDEPVLTSSQMMLTARHPDQFDNANPHHFTNDLHNPNYNCLDFKCNCPGDVEDHTDACATLRGGQRV